MGRQSPGSYRGLSRGDVCGNYSPRGSGCGIGPVWRTCRFMASGTFYFACLAAWRGTRDDQSWGHTQVQTTVCFAHLVWESAKASPARIADSIGTDILTNDVAANSL